QRPDGQSTGGDLPIRPQPLSRLASAGLGGSAFDHPRHPGVEHLRPSPDELEQRETMKSESPVPVYEPRAPEGQAGRLSLRTSMSSALPDRHPPEAVPNMATKIEIKDLNFYYKKFHALKGISLPIYDKRVTAFIGPSGCGKSTLLRVLNRIYELYPEQ